MGLALMKSARVFAIMTLSGKKQIIWYKGLSIIFHNFENVNERKGHLSPLWTCSSLAKPPQDSWLDPKALSTLQFLTSNSSKSKRSSVSAGSNLKFLICASNVTNLCALWNGNASSIITKVQISLILRSREWSLHHDQYTLNLNCVRPLQSGGPGLWIIRTHWERGGIRAMDKPLASAHWILPLLLQAGNHQLKAGGLARWYT